MKARRSRTKHPHVFNELLNRRVVSYAAAAAGAGLLGLAPPAGAQVIYTPTHVVIGFNSGYALDLANNGTTDFIIHGATSANCSTFFSELLAKPVIGNALEARLFDGENLARALPAGQAIGPSQRFTAEGLRGGIVMGEAISSPGGGQVLGSWVRAVNRYLGLKFQIDGQTHYGWARLNAYIALHTRMQVVLTGYAYQAQPNTAILAGQEQGNAESLLMEPTTEGKAGPVPSLGALALGAQGLLIWRRDPQAARRESESQG